MPETLAQAVANAAKRVAAQQEQRREALLADAHKARVEHDATTVTLDGQVAR
jgi:hypothetical protein